LERIALFVEMAGASGMSQPDLAARVGETPAALDAATASLVRSRRLTLIAGHPPRLVSHSVFEDLARKVRAQLKAFHQAAPLETGVSREEIRDRVFPDLSLEISRAVLQALIDRQEIVAEKDLLRLATHRIALTTEEQAARDALARLFAEAALQPLTLEEAVSQVAAQFGIDSTRVQRFAQLLIQSGDLTRVGELVFHRSALEALRESLLVYKSTHGPRLDVTAFKDLTGVTRKYAIPLLEYLDRQRVTRRHGESREIV
jgi:selenocysteine-specific elongation factor